MQYFLTICDAVQYAHRFGVIHRDLKPRNILVDSEGSIRLVDFGIAKLVDTASGSVLDPIATRSESRFLTVNDASPEQLRGEVPTTAMDVYSLGVVLYQLLTGRLPFALDRRHSFERQAELIEQQDPKPPSRRILNEETCGTSAGDTERTTSAEIGEARRVSVVKLRRILSGDLDAMVLKALAPNVQAGRYETASSLADNIRNYLENRPVQAKKTTFLYRVKKACFSSPSGVDCNRYGVAWNRCRLDRSDLQAALRRVADSVNVFLEELGKYAATLSEARLTSGSN